MFDAFIPCVYGWISNTTSFRAKRYNAKEIPWLGVVMIGRFLLVFDDVSHVQGATRVTLRKSYDWFSADETYPTGVLSLLPPCTYLVRPWNEVEKFSAALIRAQNWDGQLLLDLRWYPLFGAFVLLLIWVRFCVSPPNHSGIVRCQAFADVRNIQLLSCNIWLKRKTYNFDCQVLPCWSG